MYPNFILMQRAANFIQRVHEIVLIEVIFLPRPPLQARPPRKRWFWQEPRHGTPRRATCCQCSHFRRQVVVVHSNTTTSHMHCCLLSIHSSIYTIIKIFIYLGAVALFRAHVIYILIKRFFIFLVYVSSLKVFFTLLRECRRVSEP